MIIVRDTRPWLCPADAPILDALSRISANRHGVVFCVDGDGRLAGVLTDGDFRRWVVSQQDIDVHQPVLSIANLTPTSVAEDTALDRIGELLDDRIAHIPLLDHRGRLVAVATRDGATLRLDHLTIADDAPVVTVAEIGINHNGSLDTALRLVDHAADAGADCAKFQLRDLATLYRNAGQAGDPNEDLGTQYTLDLLERFALSTDDLYRAFDRCRERGLVPLCTPWDHQSVAALEHYGVPGYKIASADLTNHDLVEAVAASGRPVLLSTGMSTEAEISETVDLLRRKGAAFALLHANSTYPAPFKDVNLNYLGRLRELGRCPVGYSGHERGWHVPLAAVALGAKVVEKHLTLDRTMEGNDHKVSLLPGELSRMVDEIRQVEASLGAATPRTISQGEMMNRVTLAKSLVATRALPKGHVVEPGDVSVKSPGRGLQPNRRSELLGRATVRPVAAGEFFFPSDLDDEHVAPRPYAFGRPWGLPVRYHDVARMLERARPDFVEFHLSYQDLDVDPATYLPAALACGVAVHSPDLFPGDHILNLAAEDDAYWHRSLDELKRTIEVTHRLSALAPRTDRPVLIVSLGGFSAEAPLPATARPRLYDRVTAGLATLDLEGIELVAQTLPPFPWYLGGQLNCNLFVDPEDTAAWAGSTGYGLCLDVSHSKLTANHRGRSFAEFVEIVGPHTRHLHLVDAEGVDGEGVQIGEGDIDWPVLAEQLGRLAPSAAFIPEIWQGHKNDGEGFWVALDRLEQWF